jgi:uncharacterized protein YkwD
VKIVRLVAAALVAALLGASLFVLWAQQNGPRQLAVGPLSFQIGATKPLYRDDSAWAGYLAPESACPGAEDTSAPESEQLRAMVCLINWARERMGVARLVETDELTEAASIKAADIRLCTDFSHDACGRHPSAVLRDAGWDGSGWGENLFMGTKELGRPRVAVDRWLDSYRHRETLFEDRWKELGVALVRFSAEDQPDIAVWVAHFGGR